jgi:uncharacterized protein
MPSSFSPIEALIGGLYVGVATGLYMLLSGRIAGNSGALKALVVGPRDSKVGHVIGLISAGTAMAIALPDAFESTSSSSISLFGWGVITGLGTGLANGCTSGHGLCGLSRLSLRSAVAVPIFMGFAIASSTLATSLEMRGFSIGPVAPVVVPSARALNVSLGAAVFLVLTLVPIILSRHTSTRSTLVSVWTGQAMGSGLVIGGMVRPSVIKGALSPQQFDLTLWLLFVRLHLTPTHP